MNFFKNKLIKRFRFLNLLTLFGLFVCQTVYSQTSGDNIQYSSMYLQPFNRHAVKVPFSTSDPGTPTPIHWGMDTAWDDEGNVLRGINFIGLDRLTYGRISFQVMDSVKEDGSLSDRQINYLKSRLRHIPNLFHMFFRQLSNMILRLRNDIFHQKHQQDTKRSFW